MIIVSRHGELDQVFHCCLLVGFGCLSRESVGVGDDGLYEMRSGVVVLGRRCDRDMRVKEEIRITETL